ncbi:MAG: Nif3-like dinuclear metal center hexameric protein [Paludibacteraceae bacterium]
MLLQEIIHIIESVAPLSYQEAWDNSGLQVGDPRADIRAALLTIDITESVVSEAVSLGCNLIISHHPLLFRGVKHICGTTPQERCIIQAIRHDIAIYSSHTSMDAYLRGVSGRMAEQLGITDYRILSIGDAGVSPAVREVRSSGRTMGSEPIPHGLGVIGQLPEPMPYDEFLRMVKARFDAPYLRYTRALSPEVQTIALCGGAGAEFADEAIAQGADVFITADVKYHEMQAADGRIALVDMDHWVSEHFTRNIFQDLLQPHLPTRISTTDRTPVNLL